MRRIIGYIFIFVAAAKLYALCVSAPLLTAIDAVLGVPNSWILKVAGPIELVLGVGCLIFPQSLWVNGGVALLSLNILIYRVFWFALGRPENCPCVGGIFGKSPVVNGTISWLLTGVAVISFIYCLQAFRLKTQKSPQTAFGG
jgi:hypothetical protein